MQEIAFADGKEEKEVAISALQSTLPHGRQGDLDKQAVWRATRTMETKTKLVGEKNLMAPSYCVIEA